MSLLVNSIVLFMFANIARQHAVTQTEPIEIDRVILDVNKRPAQVVQPPKVPPNTTRKKSTDLPVRQIPIPTPVSRPHNLVITAKSIAGEPPPKEPPVSSGGKLTPGTPVSEQGEGNEITPAHEQAPVPPETVQGAPPQIAAPKPPPAPAPFPAQPVPPPPPKPVGATTSAAPSNEVMPVIPDDLTDDEYKSSVRVQVVVHVDGSFDVSLRTTSGNAEVDQSVLSALRKWKWSPALVDGVPAQTTQNFRFDFVVR